MNSAQTRKLKVILVLFCLIFNSTLIAQITYYSIADGNWNTAATWGDGCGGSVIGTTPGNTDNVVICDGNTIINSAPLDDAALVSML